jgi:hypothetical protein
MSLMAGQSQYPNFGGSPGGLSPYERLVYQDDPATTNALNAYSSYRGSSLPSASVAAPKIPGNISINTRAAYVDPNKYNKIDPNKYYVDPEAQKYQADQSGVYKSQEEVEAASKGITNFKMSPTDSIYKWKQDQAQKNALQGLAARGLSGSKYGMSTLGQAQMQVAADEAEKQYGRAMDKFGVSKDLYGISRDVYGMDYQQKSDLYGRTAEQQNALYGREYTKESDMYNRMADQQARQYERDYGLKSDNWNRSYQGAMAKYQAASDNYNRAFQNASYSDNLRMQQLANTYNMSSQMDNTRYGRMLDAMQIGAGAAGSAGGYAMQGGGNIAQMQQQLGAGIGANQLAAGNAQANFYAGLGSLPANAMSTYYTAKAYG